MLGTCREEIKIISNGPASMVLANLFAEYVKIDNNTYINKGGNNRFLHRDVVGLWRVKTKYCFLRKYEMIL